MRRIIGVEIAPDVSWTDWWAAHRYRYPAQVDPVRFPFPIEPLIVDEGGN